MVTAIIADDFRSGNARLCNPATKTENRLTTFSPSGKLAQIVFALAAVGRGLPALGIRCSNGVILASEKPHPSILSDQPSSEKISRIAPDGGVVYSSIELDFRVLVNKERKGAHPDNIPVLGVVGLTDVELFESVHRISP